MNADITPMNAEGAWAVPEDRSGGVLIDVSRRSIGRIHLE
jgi:hypothetical protein